MHTKAAAPLRPVERKESPPGAIGRLGTYPTPVSRLEAFSTGSAALWLKNDGLLHPEYGGNKVRKLELILEDAKKRGARRLLTSGAAGSHQALATALFARKHALDAAAVLCPQPYSAHAERTLKTALELGLEAIPAPSMLSTPLVVGRVFRPGDYLIAPGCAGVLGTLGYMQAIDELIDQIRAGELPEPDLIVAPLGSGGTVAGLLAGVVRTGLKTRVVGVEVVGRRPVGDALVLSQAWAVTRKERGSAGLIRLREALVIDDTQVGPGYGYKTRPAEQALEAARGVGLELDPTYTAKAFAAALELVRDQTVRHVLYWHTLSAGELGRQKPSKLAWPAGKMGNSTPELPPALRALLVDLK
jgi:D-cysteine desulfhydrase